MKINYNINHKLLALEIFNKDPEVGPVLLKGQAYQATLIMLSCISHFARNVGYCDFYKNQMADDWNINIKAFRVAEKILLEYNYLIIVKYFSRKDKTASRYAISKKLIKDAKDRGSVSLKQGSTEPKTGVHRARINNVKLFKIDKNLSNDNSHLNIVHPETKNPNIDIKINPNKNRFLQ